MHLAKQSKIVVYKIDLVALNYIHCCYVNIINSDAERIWGIVGERESEI